mmetsp:Transcript_14025/g.36232  ORF Transcript_14025/g.36232 Transcript_14025/m.36232 type:complete len:154 (+) Transcript_14025:188-649(+)
MKDGVHPLIIYIHIMRESGKIGSRHDVLVRRLQGTSWRFQSFYADFRESMCIHLGIMQSQLSLFSPIATRRALSPSQMRRCSWFIDRLPGSSSGWSSSTSLDARKANAIGTSSDSDPSANGDMRDPVSLRFKKAKDRSASMPNPKGSSSLPVW